MTRVGARINVVHPHAPLVRHQAVSQFSLPRNSASDLSRELRAPRGLWSAGVNGPKFCHFRCKTALDIGCKLPRVESVTVCGGKLLYGAFGGSVLAGSPTHHGRKNMEQI